VTATMHEAAMSLLESVENVRKLRRLVRMQFGKVLVNITVFALHQTSCYTKVTTHV